MPDSAPRPDDGDPVHRLRPAWQRQAQFTVLHVLPTGSDFGPGFLATLVTWRKDPLRCTRLDFVAVLPQPTAPALADAELAARCPLLLPGLHRIEFGVAKNTGGGPDRLVLTLAVGDAADLLPQLRLSADVFWLDLTGPPLAKALARLARPGATVFARPAPGLAAGLRKTLAEAGFVLDAAPVDATRIAGTYAPAWPRPASWPDNRQTPTDAQQRPPVRRAVVIGAGIAGACITWSLARRGWQVILLDAANGPAAGASGLPAGLMVPHVSPDDAPMSRLTRQGAALLREWIEAIGLGRAHWHEGVLQVVEDRHKARAPAAWNGLALFEWRDTPEGRLARFFPKGLAIEPAPLIARLLAASPGLTTHWGHRVASLARREGTGNADHGVWTARDADGRVLSEAPVVVVASALDSLRIIGCAQDAKDAQHQRILRPVRGQITLGRSPLDATARPLMPDRPMSGDGHFIPALRADSPWAWLVGASFERGETALQPNEAAAAANLEKLARLAPGLAEHATRSAGAGHDAWVGVRCTSPDRLPLVGAVAGFEGVHLLAAMGSRGLSLAAVCAELLACQLAGEPWPVEASLAQALEPARFTPR